MIDILDRYIYIRAKLLGNIREAITVSVVVMRAHGFRLTCNKLSNSHFISQIWFMVIDKPMISCALRQEIEILQN